MGDTWLRIVGYRAAEGHCVEEIAEYLEATTDYILAMLREQPGFQLGYWGHNATSGTMAVILYWDSREAIAAARAVLEAVHRDLVAHGVQIVGVHNFKLFPLASRTAREPLPHID